MPELFLAHQLASTARFHLNLPQEWRYIYGLGNRHRRREKAIWEMSAYIKELESTEFAATLISPL